MSVGNVDPRDTGHSEGDIKKLYLDFVRKTSTIWAENMIHSSRYRSFRQNMWPGDYIYR